MVVLAAGGSTRLGTPKQLLPYRGTTLLRHAAEVALAAARPGDASAMARTGAMMQSPVVVVIGAEAARMRAEVAGLDIQVVENPRWSDGLSTSVRTGLAALESAGSFDAAVFTTCDQPGITPDLLREMIRTYAASRPPIVACAYGGTVGVPALYDRSLFVELRELRGDAGAKRVIERHRSHVVTVPFPEAAPDVDTTDDVKGLAD